MTLGADEARELVRIQVLASQARELLKQLDTALKAAGDAASAGHAHSWMRGPGFTFAKGILQLVDLA